jgi:hypothetical protein
MSGRKTILIAAIAMTACSFPRPADVLGGDGGPGTDAPMSCTATSCLASDPVCETSGSCGACSQESDCGRFATDGLPHCASTGACAECRDSNDCPVAQPYCDSFQCRACESDTDCASAACEVETGMCLAESDTLYVAQNGTGNCTKAAPCGSITAALGMVAGQKMYIKVEPGSYSDEVVINNKTVTISGPGATLSPTITKMSAMSVTGTSVVTVDDLTFNGTFGGADEIHCDSSTTPAASLDLEHVVVKNASGWGVQMLTCASLQLERSEIIANANGGLSISTNTASFVILNDFIIDNGSSTTFGGVSILSLLTAGNRFEYNTVAGNTSANTIPAGVTCNGLGAAPNNIIYGNHGSAAEVDCKWNFPYSIVGPEQQAGAMNIDPKFNSPGTNDYTLQPGSPARNLADPSSTMNIDYQGQPRPQGPGREPGADEIP